MIFQLECLSGFVPVHLVQLLSSVIVKRCPQLVFWGSFSNMIMAKLDNKKLFAATAIIVTNQGSNSTFDSTQINACNQVDLKAGMGANVQKLC